MVKEHTICTSVCILAIHQEGEVGNVKTLSLHCLPGITDFFDDALRSAQQLLRRPELYVTRKFEEGGLDYATEMKAIECPSIQGGQLSQQDQESNSWSSDDQLPHSTEQLPSQQQLPHSATASLNQSMLDSFSQSRSAECVSSSETCEKPVEYKRGNKVFIEKDGKATKATVCEVTPRKKHLKVAVDPKQRPILVEIASLHEPVPKVLNGLTFVISGRLNEKDKTGVTNSEQLPPIILRNGGKVFTKDVIGAADAAFILVTSQKELEKDVRKINKPIVHAYKYKWPIVSKKIVLDADQEKFLPDIENYKLQLNNLDNAPTNSLVHVKVVKQSELMASGTPSAHRELKKSMRQKRKLNAKQNVTKKENNVPKQRPKKPANGFNVFFRKKYAQLAKETPKKSLSEINKIIAEQWKSLNDELKLKQFLLFKVASFRY